MFKQDLIEGIKIALNIKTTDTSWDVDLNKFVDDTILELKVKGVHPSFFRETVTQLNPFLESLIIVKAKSVYGESNYQQRFRVMYEKIMKVLTEMVEFTSDLHNVDILDPIFKLINKYISLLAFDISVEGSKISIRNVNQEILKSIPLPTSNVDLSAYLEKNIGTLVNGDDVTFSDEDLLLARDVSDSETYAITLTKLKSILSGSGQVITTKEGTQDNPVILDELENGYYLLKGYYQTIRNTTHQYAVYIFNAGIQNILSENGVIIAVRKQSNYMRIQAFGGRFYDGELKPNGNLAEDYDYVISTLSYPLGSAYVTDTCRGYKSSTDLYKITTIPTLPWTNGEYVLKYEDGTRSWVSATSGGSTLYEHNLLIMASNGARISAKIVNKSATAITNENLVTIMQECGYVDYFHLLQCSGHISGMGIYGIYLQGSGSFTYSLFDGSDTGVNLNESTVYDTIREF